MRVVVDTSALASFLAAADAVTAGRVASSAAWSAYEQENAAVFDAYLEGWGDEDRRPNAAAAMVDTAARLRAAAVNWSGLLDHVAAAMTPVVDADVEIPVVVFVGMGSSNGWVTILDGRRTVFLAAELIPDPAMGAVLAAHELTHALHHLANSAWDAGDYPVSALTFAEGLATHLSAVAVPGHRDDEYLWFDGSHQQWVAECEDLWSTGAAALRAVLDEPCGGVAERLLFTLRPAARPGVPNRFGYYAGLHAVRHLAKTRTIADLLRLDLPTAGRLVADELRRPYSDAERSTSRRAEPLG